LRIIPLHPLMLGYIFKRLFNSSAKCYLNHYYLISQIPNCVILCWGGTWVCVHVSCQVLGINSGNQAHTLHLVDRFPNLYILLWLFLAPRGILFLSQQHHLFYSFPLLFFYCTPTVRIMLCITTYINIFVEN
jgi:hypothetical protein